MNKYLKTIYLLILAIISSNAQNKKPTDFIPEEYVEFEKYFGDLNGDKQEDCVLIIKATDKNSIIIDHDGKEVDQNRRGIIILFKEKNGYQLIDKNYDCFSSENEEGGVYYPPQLSIKFKNNNLIVDYDHGRYGFWKYTFRLEDSSFKLIGYDLSSNFGSTINRETSINFLSKRKLVRKNINHDAVGGDEIFQETWSDIEIEELITLSEIEDFDELNMYDY